MFDLVLSLFSFDFENKHWLVNFFLFYLSCSHCDFYLFFYVMFLIASGNFLFDVVSNNTSCDSSCFETVSHLTFKLLSYFNIFVLRICCLFANFRSFNYYRTHLIYIVKHCLKWGILNVPV